MYVIKNYIYDSERLIFYNSNLTDEIINKITTLIDENDKYNEIISTFNQYESQAVPVSSGILSQIGISLSKNCNLRCTYCGEAATSGNDEILTLEDIMAFVSNAMQRWKLSRFVKSDIEDFTVWITGSGEPTYNWDFFVSVISEIKKKANQNSIPAKFHITTNGVLTQEQRDFLAQHFDDIMVSYDGLPSIQNKNRLSPFYPETSKIVEETIEYYLSIHKKIKIRSTVWYEDFPLLRDMATFMFTRFTGEFEWSILPVMPNGRAKKRMLNYDDTSFDKFDFLTSYLDVCEFIVANFPKAKVTTPFFPNTIVDYYCGALAFEGGCRWLMQDKRIVTCIEAHECKTVVGKVEDGKVIYYDTCNDPLFSIYKQKFQECKSCLAYRFCKGGCPIKWILNAKLHTESKNWECDVIVRYLTYVFEKLISGEECFGWKVTPIDIDGVKYGDILKLEKITGDNV